MDRIYLFCSYLEQDPLNIIDLMAQIVNVSFCLPDYTLHERYSRPNYRLLIGQSEVNRGKNVV